MVTPSGSTVGDKSSEDARSEISDSSGLVITEASATLVGCSESASLVGLLEPETVASCPDASDSGASKDSEVCGTTLVQDSMASEDRVWVVYDSEANGDSDGL